MQAETFCDLLIDHLHCNSGVLTPIHRKSPEHITGMGVIQKGKSIKTEKDEAINKIVLGAALKFIPLMLLGLTAEVLQDLTWVGFLVSLVVLGLFIQGYVTFVRGTLEYVSSKKRHSAWGWLGILSIFSLAILTYLPAKQGVLGKQSTQDEINPFIDINLIEMCLLNVISVLSICFLLVGLYSLRSELSLDQISELFQVPGTIYGTLFPFLTRIVFYSLMIILFRRSRGDFSRLLGRLKKVDIAQISQITVAKLCLGISAWKLCLYGISYFFPSYANGVLTEEYPTDIPSLMLFEIYAVVIAPLAEEFLFRGILIHKLGLKWGLGSGLVASSIWFSLVHFRFDVIPLFIAGLIYSYLYIKSGSLWPSIFCHAAYNLCLGGLALISELFDSEITYDSTEELILAYQLSVQSELWWMLPMLCASGAYLGYWLWKMKPDANAELPYFSNESRLLNRNLS